MDLNGLIVEEKAPAGSGVWVFLEHTEDTIYRFPKALALFKSGHPELQVTAIAPLLKNNKSPFFTQRGSADVSATVLTGYIVNTEKK
jgi:hypothetical protein